ncbi:PucR family transcriptional regulator [Gordonia zhaorongruii]|uniref:PucR family transcriptional regulator n=1 Tax=Gordonia zhaorongruii TaxID=2597659 RepID=UPI0010429741|nr:helix-turn-helix domain-containing protein [Gordonia zhaorongruii]
MTEYGISQSDDVVADVVASVITEMSENLVGESRHIREVLERDITELRGNRQLLDLLGDSVESNVDAVFHIMRHGISTDGVQAPSAAVEYAHRLAQQLIPMAALVRAYRLGQTALQERVFTTIEASDIEPRLGLEAARRIVSIASAYIDTVTEQVVAAYQAERDKWMSNRNTIRTVRIRELLSTTAEVDETQTSAAIGYNLNQHHCAAIVWSTAPDPQHDELSRIERVTRTLATELGAGSEFLFVAADRLTAWVWMSWPADTDPDLGTARDHIGENLSGLYVALGTPHPGSAGFTKSHREAVEARNMAELAEDPPQLRSYADPGLAVASLVSADSVRAREWVAQVLGPLAADTDAARRLRETLRVFLGNQSSNKATAEQLHLHYNTVKYRVKNAERDRGRPIADDRLDVEVALLLDYWLPRPD